ncbi:hypothetical protein FGB62_397g02 [Gracilaria domingensis]|nr:hypothetical protein FGB62_397g02 [Gracilaria domingensis]
MAEKLCTTIQKSFNLISISAPACIDGVISAAPPPNLYVDEIGAITMPVHSSEAVRLSDVGAVIRQGSQCEQDKSSEPRSCRIVDKSGFGTSPTWTTAIEKLACKAVTNLGMSRNTMKVLSWVLVILEPKSMFTSEMDTDVSSSSFVSLIVRLPSYEGSVMLSAKYAGEERRYDLGGYTKKGFHWAALRNDCRFELQALGEGIRLFVVYGIEWPDCVSHASAYRQSV